jgi:hypothetical protein
MPMQYSYISHLIQYSRTHTRVDLGIRVHYPQSGHVQSAWVVPVYSPVNGRSGPGPDLFVLESRTTS